MPLHLSAERVNMSVAPEARKALHEYLMEDHEVKPGVWEFNRKGMGYSEFVLRAIECMRFVEAAAEYGNREALRILGKEPSIGSER